MQLSCNLSSKHLTYIHTLIELYVCIITLVTSYHEFLEEYTIKNYRRK